MKIKKSYQVTIITFILLVLFIPVLSHATDSSIIDNLKTAVNQTPLAPASENPDTLAGTIGKVIGIVLGFLGIVAVILIIYGGFLWMTAGGDTGKVDKAKGLLKNAVIGLVIILASYIITSFVITKLLETTTSTTPATPAAQTSGTNP